MNADHWIRIRSVLDRVLEVPPEAQAALLEELCGDDIEIKAEVESLVAAEAEAGRLLEDPLGEHAGELLAEMSSQSPALENMIGRQMGAYRLVREVARGGMGTVYLAERADGQFEQRVAVKLLRRGLDTDDLLRRFLAERQILASLNHPNIARLLDGGAADDGRPYLVMEYVEGEPITTYCERNRLSIGDRLHVFVEICDAVQYAHRALIVHRDLKPSNILVSSFDASKNDRLPSQSTRANVKLLDFGIAKLLGSGPEDGLTVTGVRLLTPGYASPEQLQGQTITTASDVYSLGVLLYELLTGHHPFRRPGLSRHEVEQRVLTATPENPSSIVARMAAEHSSPSGTGAHGTPVRNRSASAPDRLRRRLRGDLDTIVLKAIRREPERRYSSAELLAEDLRRFLDGRPVLARPDSAAYRMRKFAGRHRAGFAVGTLALLTLLGATAFSLRQMQEARRQRDTALWESRRADAQVEFQRLLLSEVGEEPITMRQILDNGRTLLEREHATDPRFLGSILLQLAVSYAELGDTEQRTLLLARAESLATAGMAGDLLPAIRCEMAANLRAEGRYDEAWSTLDGAELLLRAVPDLHNEVHCLTVRSHLAKETGRNEESISAARRGIGIKQSLGETRDMEYLGLLNVLAGALNSEGLQRESVHTHELAIGLMDSSGRRGMLSRAIMRHNLALTLTSLGEHADAERVFREVLERAQRGDPTGRVMWQPTIHYAEAALTQGHADSALTYFNLVASRGVGDASLYWEGRGLFGAARAHVQLGNLAEARRARARLEHIIELHPRVKGTDDVIPETRTLDGLLALAEGDTASAKAHFVASLEANGYFEGKSTRRQRQVVLLAAECALALGELREARRLAREALEIAAVDSLADGRSAGVGEARLLEARAALATGDSISARALASRALVSLRFGAGADHRRTKEAEALVQTLAY